MDQNIEDIIYLIEQSDLDQTIKSILIRDLRVEGLTDFLREQIIAYSLAGIKDLNARIDRAKQHLKQNQDVAQDAAA